MDSFPSFKKSVRKNRNFENDFGCKNFSLNFLEYNPKTHVNRDAPHGLDVSSLEMNFPQDIFIRGCRHRGTTLFPPDQ